ncbi:unnamed protein product [Rhizoctonia solani]|uniref:Uncharacterized protein n=1 Tax=Rhizoctonia solani TaxID=456999 RepID=A0A8H3HYQ2_9AGAM|nr:unnamed protein product [Rhizoctonia solani]
MIPPITRLHRCEPTPSNSPMALRLASLTESAARIDPIPYINHITFTQPPFDHVFANRRSKQEQSFRHQINQRRLTRARLDHIRPDPVFDGPNHYIVAASAGPFSAMRYTRRDCGCDLGLGVSVSSFPSLLRQDRSIAAGTNEHTQLTRIELNTNLHPYQRAARHAAYAMTTPTRARTTEDTRSNESV